MMAMLALSTIPGDASPDNPVAFRLFAVVPPAIQNLLHIPLYAFLSWLWCRALKSGQWRSAATAVAAVAISAIFGFVDEFYQSVVPGRTSSLTDAIFNGVGAIVGGLLFVVSTRSHPSDSPSRHSKA
jgi:VanZ family protein